MAQHNELTTRLRAIVRELSNRNKPRGERIDVALRRLELLAEDLEAGVEGGENGA